jgi:hypothetical protein
VGCKHRASNAGWAANACFGVVRAAQPRVPAILAARLQCRKRFIVKHGCNKWPRRCRGTIALLRTIGASFDTV